MTPTNVHVYTKIRLHIQWISTRFGQLCGHHRVYKIQRLDTLKVSNKIIKFSSTNAKGVFTLYNHMSQWLAHMIVQLNFNCRDTTCFGHHGHHQASTTKIFRENYTYVTWDLYYERKLILLHRKVKFFYKVVKFLI